MRWPSCLPSQLAPAPCEPAVLNTAVACACADVLQPPAHTHTQPPVVYDVTRPESFENLERIWMKEVDIYSNIEDAVKMVVANKVDLPVRAERAELCAELCAVLSVACRSSLSACGSVVHGSQRCATALRPPSQPWCCCRTRSGRSARRRDTTLRAAWAASTWRHQPRPTWQVCPVCVCARRRQQQQAQCEPLQHNCHAAVLYPVLCCLQQYNKRSRSWCSKSWRRRHWSTQRWARVASSSRSSRSSSPAARVPAS